MKLCLFDLDHTLLRLRLDPIPAYAEVISQHGFDVDFNELERAYMESWDLYLARGFEFPTDREAYLHCAGHTLRLVGIEQDTARIAEVIMGRFEESKSVDAYGDAIATVKELRACGLRIGIATGRWHDPSSDLEMVGLSKYLDVVYYSGMFGTQKDAPDYWVRLLEREGLAAGEVVLIDDNAPAVTTARATGITAFRIQRPDSPIPSPDPVDLTELHGLPEMLESL